MEHILPLRDRLYRLALRVLADTAEAEDVVQETMVRAWTHRQEWSEMESIEAWCVTVAKHLALDRYEQQQDRRVIMEAHQSKATTGKYPPATEPSESPHGQMERRESLQIIGRLMSSLPEVQRQVMHLRDIEGQSYRQIAQTLNLSEDQVKVYLYRARQKVKQKFAQIQEYGLTNQ